MKHSFDVEKQISSFLKQFNNLMRKSRKPFRVGDHVSAFGNRGIIKSVSDNGYVIVKFDDFESTVVFNKDGRLMKWHKEVSLRKV
jgi:hypothetical protein